ncbi:type II toxin-antitoxin system PrlF family antitoxin (plasmid) [Candidatus Fukatsuia symbiotica]|nr:type II toxin-antitoxin system PrlF family antitoxin [Candidatus Fukatsuia symbiotica]MEA9445841.1 type II toxin-antitoxin system PrlF family antitoxin [Candidatus Fukatsuia symbiotica]
MLVVARKNTKHIDVLESQITSRGQTTIPASVLRTLNLKKGVDRIQYQVLPSGDVLIPRKQKEENDPIIGKFLDFLANDIVKNPQHLQALPEPLLCRIDKITEGVEIGNLDTPLPDDEG